MSIILAPDLPVSSFKWRLEHNDLEGRSVFGAQSIRIGEPVWRVSFQVIRASNVIANAVESLIDELDGKKNQLSLYHIATPVPIGTLRGNNTLYATATAGSTTMTISTTSPIGATLLKGDLIGVGSGYNQQVVRVSANAVVDSNNRISITFQPRLRNTINVGSVVVWDKPRALFRQETASTGGQYVPGLSAEGATFELREDWRP